MQTTDLPKCECGATVSLSFHGGRRWCSDCLRAEVKRLQARSTELANALSFITNALDREESEETADWEITDIRWRLRIERLRNRLIACETALSRLAFASLPPAQCAAVYFKQYPKLEATEAKREIK